MYIHIFVYIHTSLYIHTYLYIQLRIYKHTHKYQDLFGIYVYIRESIVIVAAKKILILMCVFVNT